MRDDSRLTILVLTEDAAKGAHDTVVTLLKKTFPLLVPATGTHRIDFQPQSIREHRIMHGNNWKGRTMRDLVDLRRTLATKVLEDEGGVPGFVVFHFDGDRAWSARATAENERLFEERVREPVRQLVRDTLARGGREAELDQRIRRLMTWVPYYSIEAWLYRNLDGVRRSCCGKPEHLELLNTWAAVPAALDDVDRPKSALSCIGSAHNADLAKAFPAAATFQAGVSYAATVAAMLDVGDLLAALERTTER